MVPTIRFAAGFRHGALADVEAELQQLAMDPRRAPVGFSMDMRRIVARTSGSTRGWPRSPRRREIHAQKRRNAWYDGQGRRTEERFADGRVRRTRYSRAADAVEVTDPNGTGVTQTFDGAPRLVRRDIARGSGIGGETFQQFERDGLGRVQVAENDHPRVTMADNALGQTTEETLE